jgi:hypothetical protein
VRSPDVDEKFSIDAEREETDISSQALSVPPAKVRQLRYPFKGHAVNHEAVVPACGTDRLQLPVRGPVRHRPRRDAEQPRHLSTRQQTVGKLVRAVPELDDARQEAAHPLLIAVVGIAGVVRPVALDLELEGDLAGQGLQDVAWVEVSVRARKSTTAEVPMAKLLLTMMGIPA